MVIKIGDIHGAWPWLVDFIQNQEDGTTFIQVGDFGAGYRPKPMEDEFLQLLNKDLEKRNQKLFVIRGNHDNPAFFKGDYMLGNVNLVPDYHVEEIEGARYLFIGGATSIDRKQNIEGVSWWRDEVFVADMEKLRGMHDINVVITHTSPNIAWPTTFGQIVYRFAKYDNELIADLSFERNLVTAVYQEIKRNNVGLMEWWYGHFHWSKTEHIDGVKFRLLNINETAE